ncbi:MAG: hypothetical protein JWM12_2919, partial [Ilumatobacteraceae bacterium]|nr:hypothetical protein [Ilumatobacteraceae bacterium]
MTALPAGASELYGLAPAEFVAARNALVKQLKRAKQTGDAVTVAALRRPSLADHAINAAARREPELAERWAAAVTAVAEAQSSAIGGGAAGALRETTADLRAATAKLVDAAVAAVGDEAKRNDVVAALRAATTRPGAALVGAGILGAADPDDELFAGAPDPVVSGDRPRPAATGPRATPPTAQADAERSTARATTGTAAEAREAAKAAADERA